MVHIRGDGGFRLLEPGRPRDLHRLLEAIEGAADPLLKRDKLQLDADVHRVLNRPEVWAQPYTTSLSTTKNLVASLLPGFWHSTTTCWRTADADIGPDFTGPHGDALLAAGWSQEEHDGAVFRAVVAPGGPIHAECLALLAATLKAIIAQEALKPPSPELLLERQAALSAMKADAEASRASDERPEGPRPSGLGAEPASAITEGGAPVNSLMLSALKAMDKALTDNWVFPSDEVTRDMIGEETCEAWIQIRSAISKADRG